MKQPLGKRHLSPPKYRKHLAHFPDRKGRIWKVMFDGQDLIFRVHYSRKTLRVSLKSVLHAKLLSDVDTVIEQPRASAFPKQPRAGADADVPGGTANADPAQLACT